MAKIENAGAQNPACVISRKELPVRTDADPRFVPTAKDFIDHSEVLEHLALAISENLPTLIIGETGTGKTSAVRYLAHLTQNELRRVNLNGATTPDDLVGKTLLNRDGTYWIDGVLTEALRKGQWIVLDELNAASPEVLFVLQSLLDDDHYIVLHEKDDKELVRPHPNFRLFATMNPPERYAGTKELNRALMSRFSLVVSIPLPSPEVEKSIIRYHLAALYDESVTNTLLKLTNEARKAYQDEKTDLLISTRELIQTLKVSAWYAGDVRKALDVVVLGKAEAADKKFLGSLLNLHFPTPTMKKKRKRSTEEMEEKMAKILSGENGLRVQKTFLLKDTTCDPTSLRIFPKGVEMRGEKSDTTKLEGESQLLLAVLNSGTISPRAVRAWEKKNGAKALSRTHDRGDRWDVNADTLRQMLENGNAILC